MSDFFFIFHIIQVLLISSESTPRPPGPTFQDHFSHETTRTSPSVLPSPRLKKKSPTTSTPLPLHSPLRRQVTRERAHRAPLGLQRDGLHAAVPKAVPKLVQARQRGADVAARAAPEHLCGGGGARPHDRVEVLRTGLLGPEQLLPAEHERRLRRGQVRERVEGVGLCDACARRE